MLSMVIMAVADRVGHWLVTRQISLEGDVLRQPVLRTECVDPLSGEGEFPWIVGQRETGRIVSILVRDSPGAPVLPRGAQRCRPASLAALPLCGLDDDAAAAAPEKIVADRFAQRIELPALPLGQSGLVDYGHAIKLHQ